MGETNGKIRELIKSGELGKIYQVQANINVPEGTVVEKPIPEGFDFETFCGPAPRSGFLCDPDASKPDWRAIYNFNRGILFDWGIHYIHNIRRVMNLGLPNTVSAIGGKSRNKNGDHPDHLDVRFEFDGLPVYWSHKTWGHASPMPDNNIGVFYYGDKATAFAGDMGYEIYHHDGSRTKNGDIRFDPGNTENGTAYGKMMTDLFVQFADGIRGGSNAGIVNPLDDAQATTATVTLGDIAYRTNSGLSVDPRSLNIQNNAAAQSMLKRDYRAPYKHPWK